ncbi:MAG: hypothetical protein ACJ71O_18110 [Nitrososphaeraceae archaeon]
MFKDKTFIIITEFSLIVIILGLQGITIHRAFEATPDVINITDDSKNIQNNILITNTLTKKTNSTTNSICLFLSKGYVNGKIAFFIATDASDNGTAASITKNPGLKVNFAPALAFVPESSRQQGYEFINGVRGEGSFGFQLPIASALPGDKNYTPLVQLNFVKWNSNNSSTFIVVARELKSVNEIMAAEHNGDLSVAKTNIIINSPAVMMSNK